MARFGWRRPRWKDPAFWVAIGITTVVVAVQVVLLDRSSSYLWAGVAVRVVVSWLVISSLLRIRVGLSRGLVRGFEDAEAGAQARPSGQSRGEAAARVGGRVVGKALGAYRRTQR